ALVWLCLMLLVALWPEASDGFPILKLLPNIALALFVADWFRYSLRLAPLKAGSTLFSEANPRRLARNIGRMAFRIAVVVVICTAVLIPPTMVLAAGTLAIYGGLDNPLAME